EEVPLQDAVVGLAGDHANEPQRAANRQIVEDGGDAEPVGMVRISLQIPLGAPASPGVNVPSSEAGSGPARGLAAPR
ncbi:MAG: hypothetical protein ACOCWR_09760, partial [Oceanidesulfovibrio sp.]